MQTNAEPQVEERPRSRFDDDPVFTQTGTFVYDDEGRIVVTYFEKSDDADD